MKMKFITVLAVVLFALGITAGAAFTDIGDPETAEAAEVLQTMGILGGVGDGKYSPDTILTRAQFCTIAVRLMEIEELADTRANKMLFTDTRPGSWYTGYVNLAWEKGLVNGYGNALFGPDDSLTWGQVVTIILRLLGYSSSDVGNSWPNDWISYAEGLGICEGIELRADDTVSRADAAILVYNTLLCTNKSGKVYYTTRNDSYESFDGILISCDSGELEVCVIGNAGVELSEYDIKRELSSDFIGRVGKIILDSEGDVSGFIPETDSFEDVVISSADLGGLTDESGTIHRFSGDVDVISDGKLYRWGDTGYVIVSGSAGKRARIYRSDSGEAEYIWVSSLDEEGEIFLVGEGQTFSDISDFFDITSEPVVLKNGKSAEASDVAVNDTALWDPVLNVVHLSDLSFTGYIESAIPGFSAPQRLVASGVELNVLESAWDTLKDCSVGTRVTLFLTENNSVAFVSLDKSVSAEMFGVLSDNGKSVTLCKTGFTVTADTVEADPKLYGKLVSVKVNKSSIECEELEKNESAAALDIASGRLGALTLASDIDIFECNGDEHTSMVYDLSGNKGRASDDFKEIEWTSIIPASAVVNYHLNGSGKVDMLLLRDVTGNAYSYGKATEYEGGINLTTTALVSAFYDGVTLKNSESGSKESEKHIFNRFSAIVGTYSGISVRQYTENCCETVAFITLNDGGEVSVKDFTVSDDVWYVNCDVGQLEISNKVEIYTSSTKTWSRGVDALKELLASGGGFSVWYDRSLETGAKIRVIEY